MSIVCISLRSTLGGFTKSAGLCVIARHTHACLSACFKRRDEDYLILSTIHSAKGQEWRSVFVLNCVDGCIPSDLATGSTPEIEEERRLLYVAMTRAKDHLHMVIPQRFFAHQQRVRWRIARFFALTRAREKHHTVPARSRRCLGSAAVRDNG